MVYFRKTRNNPFVTFILGVIFIVVSFIGGISLYKEYFLICNSSDDYKGMCIIFEKGLLGESKKAFPSNLIINIGSEEHVSRSKSGSKSYSYSVHSKLADGQEIVFPPGTTVSAEFRDEIINKLTALKNSGGTIPLYINHDSRIFGIIVFGFCSLVGVILIFTSFFRSF